MAKNTASNKFRMVDVDQYNEDNFKDDDSAVVQDKRGGLSDSEVEALIQKGNNADALQAVLSSAPIGNKNQDEKVNCKFNLGENIEIRLMDSGLFSLITSKP